MQIRSASDLKQRNALEGKGEGAEIESERIASVIRSDGLATKFVQSIRSREAPALVPLSIIYSLRLIKIAIFLLAGANYKRLVKRQTAESFAAVAI